MCCVDTLWHGISLHEQQQARNRCFSEVVYIGPALKYFMWCSQVSKSELIFQACAVKMAFILLWKPNNKSKSFIPCICHDSFFNLSVNSQGPVIFQISHLWISDIQTPMLNILLFDSFKAHNILYLGTWQTFYLHCIFIMPGFKPSLSMAFSHFRNQELQNVFCTTNTWWFFSLCW